MLLSTKSRGTSAAARGNDHSVAGRHRVPSNEVLPDIAKTDLVALQLQMNCRLRTETPKDSERD